MKKLAMVVAASSVLLSATSLTAVANDSIAEGLCTAISADDRQRLRTILSNHNMRVRNIYTSIRCNNYSMLQFAITAEAEQVGEMLTRQLPASVIDDDTVNGEHILSWAESTGYGSSAVVAAVRNRISD
ncbi:hypothetical protein CWE09_10475 [Aliidiomarina minuta]|uniref:DUF3718 domain-containing protein n=1 Tax=Aliidiomarina minuta TaxID=880057 RepID=A0A432W4D4_9GAMM|nr:DUF3718 domain-containing protein [Aliidiomarina minuta]RUO24294.1 hypothetical protein CWE09_10475 [Aliidiomarina minuta]